MKKRYVIIGLVSFLIVVALFNNHKSQFDVATILGSDKNTIDKRYGIPNCPPKNACEYGDNFDIYYHDNIAYNVTLPPTENLRDYGLYLGSPDFVNDSIGYSKWTITINNREVEVQKFIDYVYIKTKE